MTNSIILIVAVALQAGAPSGGLPSSLRQDIEKAAAQPTPNITPAPNASVGTVAPDTQPVAPPAPPAPPPPPPPPPAPAVFGLNAYPSKITLEDQRWVRIGMLPSRNPLLAAMIRGAAGLSRYQQASFVQATVNSRLVYRLDQDNWGIKDYWASADETIARGAGDCEDLALVKLQALRLLGFDERDLYLMAGTKPSGDEHALLLVRIDGRFWVLEDGLSRLVAAESFRMFRPEVSYGAGWKWVHGTRPPEGQGQSAAASVSGLR